MKITFVTPTPLDLSAFGVRALSAFLKREGMDVRSIFLPGGVERYKFKDGFSYQYDHRIIQEVIELCSGSDLIGISFMSNYYDRAVQLTEAIKSVLNVPVVWGGIHATIMPEQSLRHADFVCVGEGEYAMLELLVRIGEQKDPTEVKNIWAKKDGSIIRNTLRPLEENLDRFPYLDFSLENHFVHDLPKNTVVPMTNEILRASLLLEPNFEDSFIDSYKRTRNYKTMTTRGCPHACTYCAENTLARMYKGQKYLRMRSVPHIIGELETIRKRFPFVESIFLFDDTFMIRSNEEISLFSTVYKEKIGLPFHIQTSPATLTEEKMAALVEAGMCFVEIGIQSASDTGRRVYKRHVSNQQLLNAARILDAYRGKIYPPRYHLILDNPWETREDVLQTLNLVLQLPKPFSLCKSSLVFFPGTPLFMRAQKEGIIKDEEDLKRQVFNKHFEQPSGNYVNFLIYLAGFCGFPRSVLKLLAKPQVVDLLDRKSFSNLYTLAFKVGDWIIVFYKGIRAVVSGDFGRIKRFVVRRISPMS